MVREAPKFNPRAREVRIIRKEGYPLVQIMSDGTFRVHFYPYLCETSIKPGGDEKFEHFASGIVLGKTDQQILDGAITILGQKDTQYFDADGSLHKVSRKSPIG